MSIIKTFVQFFKDAYRELTKVTWLGRKEAIGITAVIVIFIAIMSVFVSVVDLLLGIIIRVVV